MKIVDLSLPIDETAFEVHKVAIERVTHKAGVEKFNRVIMGKTLLGKIKYALGGRIVKKEELPDEEFLSLEIVHAPVHIGTHLDYSFHYGSQSENRASKTADEIPLEYCYQPGVKLDLRHKKPNEVIKEQDLCEALTKINYQLKPLDIVLLQTGADKLYGGPKYFADYPGVSPCAIEYLLGQGVKIFGVDTMGIDRPYRFMLSEFLKTKDPKTFYPAHFYGRKKEFIHIERLANLESLPDFGFKVLCMPIRIKNTGAAWARVVALLD
ncbi:MAG TPA: cyclase family protein [Candidatus Omnitrophota bacterium]|nr:cyclase family protein [Candidatus Omnitrophota bacterium]HPT38808.1 cyclase family protein [Candidatus Omnitrophota bacterium]